MHNDNFLWLPALLNYLLAQSLNFNKFQLTVEILNFLGRPIGYERDLPQELCLLNYLLIMHSFKCSHVQSPLDRKTKSWRLSYTCACSLSVLYKRIFAE